MRALLEILSGHDASKRLRLEAGRPLRVGRLEPAELILHQDEHLAAIHFSLDFNGTSCQLRVLSPGADVQMEGKSATAAELRDGSIWVAGQTWFSFRMKPPMKRAQDIGKLSNLLEELEAAPASLFGLLDAARDERVLALLRASDEESQSLYEGLQGQLLATQAPYLIKLTSDSVFLPCLLQQGWGKSWGIFLTSHLPLAEVRRHFRRFLFARDELGREVYLRFYDPRVLRFLLPACSVPQTAALFDGIDSFLLEGRSPQELIRFTWNGQGLAWQQVEIGSGGKLPSGHKR